MIAPQVLRCFKGLDYSGTFAECLARIPTDVLDAIPELINAHQSADTVEPFLWFGVQRLGCEQGRPIPMVNDFTHGAKLAGLARTALILARMERDGRIEVKWPETLFISPAAKISYTMTDKGRAHFEQLKAKG